MEEKNPEKMERPRPWPDPPSAEDQTEMIMAGKKPNIEKVQKADKENTKKNLPELQIQCPACNDVSHRMTIFFNELSSQKGEYYIRCDKCLALFKLKQCSIMQTISTSSTTPSTS